MSAHLVQFLALQGGSHLDDVLTSQMEETATAEGRGGNERRVVRAGQVPHAKVWVIWLHALIGFRHRKLS